MKRNRVVLFTVIAIAGLSADLWTKHLAFSSPKLLAHQVHWLIPNHVGLQLSLNEGGLFGMGQGSQSLLAAFSVVAAIAIPLWLFYFNAATDRLLTIALGGVMGGVLGNLYDRVGLHGLDWNGFQPSRAGEPVYAVRDFILLAARWDAEPAQRLVWPNFNIADSLLVVGAMVIFYRAMRPENRASTNEAKTLSKQIEG